MDMDRAHLILALPVWTLGTWALLMLLAWCVIGMRRMVVKLGDRVSELSGKQDAYFGLPHLDVEALRIRDMEERRIRTKELDQQEARVWGPEDESDNRTECQ